MPDHIYLCGYRGTGKTSVGRLLADRLDRPFVDVDASIQQNAGKTVGEIFRSGGEFSFRDLETEAIDEIAGREPHVVSLGGGAILRKANRLRIERSSRCTIWLQAQPKTVLDRVRGDHATAAQRPPLTEMSELEEIKALLRDRRPLYELVADHPIDTDNKTIQQVVDEILLLLKAGD